jgi:hypothetical protein
MVEIIYSSLEQNDAIVLLNDLSSTNHDLDYDTSPDLKIR